MSFIKYLLTPKVIGAILLRIILFLTTDFYKALAHLPFMDSLYYSYDQRKEAFYLMDKGLDPYTMDLIFQVTKLSIYTQLIIS